MNKKKKACAHEYNYVVNFFYRQNRKPNHIIIFNCTALVRRSTQTAVQFEVERIFSLRVEKPLKEQLTLDECRTLWSQHGQVGSVTASSYQQWCMKQLYLVVVQTVTE